MIGDKEQSNPGLAPRAFNRIFDLVEKNKQKFSFKVSLKDVVLRKFQFWAVSN